MFTLRAQPLFRGSLQEALSWSQLHRTDFSTIPALFGSNQSATRREGHVIRPVKEAKLGPFRFILKDKDCSFQKEQIPKAVAKAKAEAKAKEEKFTLDLFLDYLTKDLMESVASKFIPGTDPKTHQELTDDFFLDVQKNIEADGFSTKRLENYRKG